MKLAVRLTPLLVLHLTTASCVQEAEVKVTKQGESVQIVVSRPGSEPPCVDSLSVSLAGTDIKTTPTLWDIATSDMKNCRTNFIYGQVPPGWSQSNVAPRLKRGVNYAVDASGPGVLGGTPFTFRDGDGVLSGSK